MQQMGSVSKASAPAHGSSSRIKLQERGSSWETSDNVQPNWEDNSWNAWASEPPTWTDASWNVCASAPQTPPLPSTSSSSSHLPVRVWDAETQLAKDNELSWRDRGPSGPYEADAGKTWKNQKFRDGSHRWGNRGGQWRHWYSVFYGALRQGAPKHEASALANKACADMQQQSVQARVTAVVVIYT